MIKFVFQKTIVHGILQERFMPVAVPIENKGAHSLIERYIDLFVHILRILYILSRLIGSPD